MPSPTFINPQVRQRVMLVAESGLAAGGTPTTELLDLKLELTSDGQSSQHTPAGSIVPGVIVPNEKSVTGKISGAPGFASLPYVLDSAFGPGSGGVWTPSPFIIPARTSYAVVQGVPGNAYFHKGVVVSGFKLHFAHDGNTLDGSLLGISETPGGATMPTSATTTVDNNPIKPGTLGLWSCDTWAGTYARFATIGLMADFDFSSLIELRYGLDDRYGTGPIGIVEVMPQLSINITALAEVSGSDYAGPFTQAAYDAATPIFVKLLASDGTKTFHITASTQLLKPPARQEQDGMVVVNASLGFRIDDTTGHWLEIGCAP